jgi:hypothetical protein
MALMEINWKADQHRLRVFGAAGLAVFTLLAEWVFRTHRLFGLELAGGTAEAVAWALWALAAFSGILAASAPAALRLLYVALTAVALPVGWVVSNVLLAIVYYGILTPIGLALRLAGRDPLHRTFDRPSRSYWVDRPAQVDVRRYFRQF